jgi:hypothetical protein
MTRCKACGAEYRKGRRRLLLEQDGSLTSARVCDSCAKRAVCIVAPIVPFSPPAATPEAAAAARLHREQIQAAKRRVRTYIASATAQAGEARESGNSNNQQYQAGRADGLDTALALLEVLEEGRMP